MTSRQRILADRLLASPVAFLFNALARLLGALLRRDHSLDPATTRTIVVSKLVGMGSVIQATPLLRALKQHFRGARLIFVTLRSNRDLVERLEGIDEVLCLDDRNVWRMATSTLASLTRLIRLHADFYVDLELYSAFASLLALWAVTRNRVGFYRHTTSFKMGIYTHLVYFNTRMPVRRLYLQLARVIGAPRTEQDQPGPIRVDAADRAGLREKLALLPGWRDGIPYVVINPNASDLMLERRWPAEHVLQAVEALASPTLQLVLIGAPDESAYVRSLCERLPASVRAQVCDSSGRLALGELLALLEDAACVLTNDTGPMHMAVALGRPTVCLFGPVHPDHHGHDRSNVITLYAPVFCSPCVHEIDEPPCHGNNVCMQRLEPGRVVSAVHRLVEAGAAPGGPRERDEFAPLPVVSDAPDGSPLGFVVRGSLPKAR